MSLRRNVLCHLHLPLVSHVCQHHRASNPLRVDELLGFHFLPHWRIFQYSRIHPTQSGQSEEKSSRVFLVSGVCDGGESGCCGSNGGGGGG